MGCSLLPLFQYASFTNAQGGTREESLRANACVSLMRAIRVLRIALILYNDINYHSYYKNMAV
jgi:hypothetical protein